MICWQPECKVADPICTLLFSLVVMWTTFPTARDVFRVLMDGKRRPSKERHHGNVLKRKPPWSSGVCSSPGAPPGISVASVQDALLSVRGVAALHRLHVWSLDLAHALLCVHITAGNSNMLIFEKGIYIFEMFFFSLPARKLLFPSHFKDS